MGTVSVLTIVRTEGDTDPAVTFQLLEDDGTAVDLSGVTAPTAVCYLQTVGGATPSPASIPVTIDILATGSCTLDTDATDGLATVTAGDYVARVEVLGDSGAYRRTFPSTSATISIVIVDDFGDQ